MAQFASMVDMARDQEDMKEDAAPVAASQPVYPYGLCISLSEDELDKLDLGGELPSVGEMIHLKAMAKVTSVSESEREDTETGEKKRCCRVELQITHLATENEDREDDREARRKRFYSDDEKSE